MENKNLDIKEDKKEKKNIKISLKDFIIIIGCVIIIVIIGIANTNSKQTEEICFEELELNQQIAVNTHIYTNDEKIDTLINNMLNIMVEQDNVKLESNSIIDYYDFNSKIRKQVINGEDVKYVVYNNENGTIYEKIDINKENTNSFITLSKYDVLNDIFYDHEIELFRITGNDIKLENEEDYNIIINEYENKIEYYYISKQTGLLEEVIEKEKSSMEIKERCIITYNNNAIALPENITNSNEWEVKHVNTYIEYIEMYDKPIIYIYPEKKTEVTVKLGNPELLTVTYPKYESEGWKVIAEPDGTLEDVKTGRELYCLYWEGLNSKEYEGELKEGFVVQGEETAKFLEEKLEILGLNEKETQEFIIYWLPKLEVNNYNYIRFRTKEEIETNMPLEINPNPDTIIRVMMEWKGLENPVEVEEQSLEKAERKGYTVVEWGGTELK